LETDKRNAEFSIRVPERVKVMIDRMSKIERSKLNNMILIQRKGGEKMIVVKCAFCEAPVIKVDEFGFCRVCEKAFSVLTKDEIRAIQDKVGFKKETPDREFSSSGAV